MKFGLWTANGALNSKPIFSAFKKGAERLGHVVVENQITDIEVIWSVLWHGRMANNKAIWNRCKQQQKPVIVLEVGGLRRGTTWRLGVNGVNRDAYFGPTGNDSVRSTQLGLQLNNWRTVGQNILIACQHKMSGQWSTPDEMSKWCYDTVVKLREHTDRRIIIRPHPRCPFNEISGDNIIIQQPRRLAGTYDDFNFDISNSYAVVNWSSNPGLQSAMQGIPVFVGPSSLAWDVANQSLNTINNPILPDRTQWLNDLAYTEWTIDEIANGIPLLRLTSYLEECII